MSGESLFTHVKGFLFKKEEYRIATYISLKVKTLGIFIVARNIHYIMKHNGSL